jgi:hypothetical protein
MVVGITISIVFVLVVSAAAWVVLDDDPFWDPLD